MKRPIRKAPSVALGLYSVYRELQADIEPTLARVRELGYEGVEFYGKFTHPPERIRSLMEQNGLVNCGWHTEWELLQVDTLAATLDYHQRAGTRNVIIPALGGPWEIAHTREEDSPEVWIRHAQKMNELSDLLQQQGMRLGYHTHAHEFATRYTGGITPWDLLCEHLNKDVILELDTGNCLEAGVHPEQVLAAIPGRPLLVHGKPYSHKSGLETCIGAEDEANDWPAILQQCRIAGTEWLIIEHESEKTYPGFVGAERSLHGIRTFMEER
ncbi:MAG: sugar phosphate isomerase/epimerase [Gorillibacterium sp.]|nr:sugar phosphate isomerase/epimerase [Gorillibacterium sp.]